MTPRERHLLKKFGITTEQYDDLLRRQHSCCGVCGRPATEFRSRLSVDHDHHSGEIRGLLCVHCNRFIVGRHRRENGASLLLAAYEYLAREVYTNWIAPPKLKKKRKRKWTRRKKS